MLPAVDRRARATRSVARGTRRARRECTLATVVPAPPPPPSSSHVLTDACKAEIAAVVASFVDARLVRLSESIAGLRADVDALRAPRSQTTTASADTRTAMASRALSRASSCAAPSRASSCAASSRAPSPPSIDSVDALARAIPHSYEAAFEAAGGPSAVARARTHSQRASACVPCEALNTALTSFLPRDLRADVERSTAIASQRFVSSLDELYEFARGALAEFSARVVHAAAQSGGTATIAPLKSRTRARMKAQIKYVENSGRIAWHRLTDLVRAVIVYADIDEMYAAISVVTTLMGVDNLREFNDRYVAPLRSGYRDLQLLFDVNGHVCELQLTTVTMQRAKSLYGHRDFEVMRELTAAVDTGNIAWCEGAFEFARAHFCDTNALLRTEKGAALAHAAALHGHADILHALLAHGADANARTGKRAETPLHAAIGAAHESCVWALLCSNNVDLDACDADGRTALVCGYVMLWTRPGASAVRAVATLAAVAGVARIDASRAVAHSHVRSKMQRTRLLAEHAADGAADALRALLTAYADPDSTSREGVPALCLAITSGSVATVQALLDFRANITCQDACGQWPIDFAAGARNSEIAHVVLAEHAREQKPIDARHVPWAQTHGYSIDNKMIPSYSARAYPS